MPTDVCPVCSEGTLRITDTTRISWTAVCDLCGEPSEITDYELGIVRDYYTPKETATYAFYLVVIAVCFLLAALMEMPA